MAHGNMGGIVNGSAAARESCAGRRAVARGSVGQDHVSQVVLKAAFASLAGRGLSSAILHDGWLAVRLFSISCEIGEVARARYWWCCCGVSELDAVREWIMPALTWSSARGEHGRM